MRRNNAIVQACLATMLLVQTGSAMAICKYDAENQYVMYLDYCEVGGTSHPEWNTYSAAGGLAVSYGVLPYLGETLIKGGSSVYLHGALPEGYKTFSTSVYTDGEWRGIQQKVGVSLGALRSKSYYATSARGSFPCWSGWRNTTFTRYKYTYEICYKTIEFIGFDYDRRRRNGATHITVDPDVRPSSAKIDVIGAGGVVVFTSPVNADQTAENSFSYPFDTKTVTPGTYTLRTTVVDTDGNSEYSDQSIVVDPVIFVDNDYDPKTRIGHVTVEDFWNNPQGAHVELRNSNGTVAYQIASGARSDGGQQFTYPYSLGNAPVGTYEAWAVVNDGQGNPAEMSLGSVTIEPVIFSNYYYTTDNQTASITIHDVGEHPRKVVAELINSEGQVARTVEGEQTSANGEIFDYTFRYGGVPSGDYTVRIIATDTWGNDFSYADAMHDGEKEVHLITAEVTSFIYDEISRDGTIQFTDLGKAPKSGTVVLTSQEDPTQQWTMPAVLVRDLEDDTKFSYTFNLDGAPEGHFVLSFDIFDTFETTVSETYPGAILIDKTAPVITVVQPEEVRALQDVKITIKDNFDPAPQLVSVHLSGGPDNVAMDLDASINPEGGVTLSDPGLFPSLSEDDPAYTLTVTAIDDQQNEAVKVSGFSYKTDLITILDGMDNKLWVPAVNYQFLRQSGKATIVTDPFRDADQQPITGTYDVVAMLRADAPAPVVLNGVTIEPGTRAVIGRNDFTATGGKLEVLAHAAVEDVTGVASVVITTTAPYAPAVQADLHLWKADVALESQQWVFRQVIDKLDVIAMPGENVPCRTTVDEAAAMAADPIRDPVCLVVWTQTPDEAEVSDAFKSGMRVAGLVGQAVRMGQQNIAYDLYLYSGDGERIQIGSGAKVIDVVSALGAIELGLKRDKPQVYRTIEDVEVAFEQTKGPSCNVTLDASQAISAAATATNNSRSQLQLTCLFEWLDMPGTLVQDKYATVPKAVGQLNELGEHPLQWRLSTFSKAGVRITLAEQAAALEVVDPPAPTLGLDAGSAQIVGSNILVAPVDANAFGNVKIEAVNSDLVVEISEDGKPVSTETVTVGRYGDMQSLTRALAVPKLVPLWHKSTFTVKASYARLPEVHGEIDVEGYVAPMASVRPAVESSTNMAIDTELLPVSVRIQDMYRFRDPYDLNTMGVWEVRVLRQDSANGDQAITDWVQTQDGVADFDLPIGEVDARTVRFYAEAKLISPIEGYERIEQSQRPLLFAVLKGGEVNADVVTRKLSGEAPFQATFKAVLQDREMYNSTGDIIWQVSDDNGATWKSFMPEDRYKFQYAITFNKGDYLVRAVTKNKYSGKEATTEQVQIIAYEKPVLKIDNAEVAFVGSTQTLTAMPIVRVLNEETQQIEEQPVDLDAASIEWSTDGGKTFTATGSSLTMSSETPIRFSIWARVRSTDAPADDAAAYSITKKSLEFKAIREPRVRVVGPSVIETGKTYTFTATTDLPYNKMEGVIKGYFTMPDGTTVDAETADYTPTKDDLASGYLHTTYTAWVEGYEDKGAKGSHTLRSRVWQYVWPNFTIDYRADAPVAPATVNLRVRTTNYGGQLDEPTYKWALPTSGVQLLDASNPITRQLQITEPGSYMIHVTVSDARGNQSVVDLPVEIGQAEPYKLDLTYTASNRSMRAPVEILMRANISGGHPKDRIDTVEWLADGQPVVGSKTYGRTVLTEGEHTIGMRVVSLMGKTEQAEAQITVVPNKAPVCETRGRESINSVIVYADCTDEDGVVRMYEWNIGGEIRVNSSRSISITRKRDEAIPPVSVIAIDDSEGRSAPVQFVGAEPAEEEQH